jgi:hypothetical protein
MVSLFERLDKERPPQTRAVINQQRGSAAGAKTFLMDILTNGPVPATLIEERGAARRFSKKQLIRAKRDIGVVVFKEKGKITGRWFWALPQHDPRRDE